MTGKQLLLLQGAQRDTIFGNETQKQIQDLAGNAMSTTVIAAALVSALTASKDHLKTPQTSNRRPMRNPRGSPRKFSSLVKLFSLISYSDHDLVEADKMQVQTLSAPSGKSIDLKELITEASLSAKLCSCEGRRNVSTAPISECEVCGHTACLNCSGNPKHKYEATPTEPGDRKEPSDFESKWRPQMPLRLRLRDFPKIEEFLEIIGSAPNTVQRSFLDILQEADLQSERFCLDDLDRGQSGWTAVYRSSRASLKLVLDDEAYWLVYLNCPKTEPGDSLLRKYLTQPIARAVCKSSILETDWEVRTPKEIKCTLTIVASKSQTTSWKNDLGLVGFKMR